MKLRIKGNTIRVRLSEPEVSLLNNGGSVEEKTLFPNSVLSYIVQPSAASSAEYHDSTILIKIAENDIKTWATTDQASISTEISTGNDDILSILVEKDFQCLTERLEDESDLYPNPNEPHS